MLTNVRDEVQRIIRNKRIWPFPSVADGPDSGFEERVNICKREKYQIWQSKKVEEQGKAWKLLNGKFSFLFNHQFQSVFFFHYFFFQTKTIKISNLK